MSELRLREHTAALQCHVASPCAAISSIQVGVQLSSQLILQYRVSGEVEQLRIPAGVTASRRDELWRHTCAELFVALPEQAGYFEFNFSPSGEWAAYEFDAYRQGMRQAVVQAPVITCHSSTDSVLIDVTVTLPDTLQQAAQLQAGLSMMIEDSEGQCSYWAVTHAANRPDFHRRDGFVLIL